MQFIDFGVAETDSVKCTQKSGVSCRAFKMCTVFKLLYW